MCGQSVGKSHLPTQTGECTMAITELELKALKSSDADANKRLTEDGMFGKVRKNRTGVIVFFEYRYRCPSTGKIRAIKVGTWPTNTLKEIRSTRNRYRADVEQGVDPLEMKTAIKLSKQADILTEQESAINRIEEIQSKMRVNDLFEHWAQMELIKRKDKGAEIRRMFNKDVLPEIGALGVNDVRQVHIASMLDKVLKRGVKRMTNLLLSQVRQMFLFAKSRAWVEVDPTDTLRKKNFGGKETERNRVLSVDEIAELVAKLPSAKLSDATTACLWIMLATLARVGEISKAKWTDVDLINKKWRIPAENAKNGIAHTVDLSDFAVRQFKILKVNQTCVVFVCPASSLDINQEPRHIDTKAITKQIRDRQRIKPLKGRTKASSALLLSGGAWTPHDLRRSGATLMSKLGMDSDVIERCLNHVEPNRMKRIYQQDKKEMPMGEAWRVLGQAIADIIQQTLDASNHIG